MLPLTRYLSDLDLRSNAGDDRARSGDQSPKGTTVVTDGQMSHLEVIGAGQLLALRGMGQAEGVRPGARILAAGPHRHLSCFLRLAARQWNTRAHSGIPSPTVSEALSG